MPFAAGEFVLLLDPAGKRHLVRLGDGDTVQHHQGAVAHADIIGQPEGARIRSSQGRLFVAVRPRLVDAILEMARRSGIVYPKDAAHLLAWADVPPGHCVLESGVGSGALTLALLRTVGEHGQVIGYELRSTFWSLPSQTRARMVLRGTLSCANATFTRGIEDRELDRVVLDLPEPWRVLPHLPGALRQGGWVATYTPSILQMSKFFIGEKYSPSFPERGKEGVGG